MTIKQAVSASIFFTLLGVLSISCTQDYENSPVGEDWIDLDTKVLFIDSLSIKTSTFKFDSISVSNTSRLLLGAYTDPVFGLTKSKVFTQLSNYSYSLSNDAVFDSIALILNYDNYFYNDTIPSQTINIYEVEKDIEPDEDAYEYYNTTNITPSSTSIGLKTFIPKPKKDDSLHVTLSNTFGKMLFEDIRDNQINNIDEFLKVYKGLLIDPSDNNTAILGISTSSFLRIYYTLDNEISEESQTLDMGFNTENSFHNVSNAIEGTIFESLTDKEVYLPSTQTNNNVYAQAGTGIATKIDIPYLNTIYDIPGSGIIVDANIKLTLKQNSATKNLHTNDSLSVYIIDEKSNILSALTDTQGSTVLALIESEDAEFNITTYNISVKNFLNLKLTDLNGDDYSLALYPKDFNQSINRYILNGEAATSNIKSKLELTYAIYDK